MDDERWRTDTAERPAVVVPPEPARPAPPPGPAAPLGPAVPPPRPPDQQPPQERTPLPGWVAWVIVGLALVLAAVVGVYLAVQPPGTSTAVDPAASTPESSVGPSDDATAEPTEQEPTEEEPAEEEPSEPAETPEAIAIRGFATVAVPGAAPPNNDVTGERVTFVGANMLDGKPETCWRVAGDATGAVITFTFDQPYTVTQVAMVNGYAKTSFDASGRGFDWYHGNRRVQRAEWVVGGETFPQDLGDSTAMQVIDIGPVEATEIELRLSVVTAPGAGPTGRDYTAISDVAFAGYAS